MGWTATTVKGQKMWEQDGVRVRNMEDIEAIENARYGPRKSVSHSHGDPTTGLLFIGALFGFLAGLIVGLAVMKAQMG